MNTDGRAFLLRVSTIATYLALAGCYAQATSVKGSAPARSNRSIVAVTGEPQLRPGAHLSLTSFALSDFMMAERAAKSTQFYTPVHSIPNTLSAYAIAGRDISLGYSRVAWVLDGNNIGGYVFYFDKNRNGDLTDDQALSLTKKDAEWFVDVSHPGLTPDGVQTMVVFRIRVLNGVVFVEYETIREGHVRIGSRKHKFFITGVWGYYGLGPSRVFFDVDGDGVVNVSDSGKDAIYYRNRMVILDGVPYWFSTTQVGDKLTLTPAITKRVTAVRRSGQKTPDIRLETIFGESISLAQYRGRIVILDFWSMSCPPCLSEIPELKRLHEEHPELVIIGVTPDSDHSRLRSFISSHDMRWVIVPADLSHRIYSIFNVDRFPNYIVIARDGRITCDACSLVTATRLLQRN